ncbi:MAG: ATP synthase F1 subunit gamma [Candidatus Omnitrophica bacterium]|nr:ATP synthase F1 subunit gamma [Candidatus Omnitrophota bacterium]
MQNLRALRQRIRSVESTKKITRAMQMVAGAKLRRLQGEYVSFKPYAQRLAGMTQRFLAAHPEFQHPLLEQTKRGQTLEGQTPPVGLIVVSSDTGLCGTYNERVSEAAQRFLQENPTRLVVTIGKKANRVISRQGIPRAKEILDWGGRLDPGKAAALASWMRELYLGGQVSGWWIAATEFISALSWKASVSRLLPVERPAPVSFPERIITEPGRKAFGDELLHRFVDSQFSWRLLSAFTAEHSARMIAMKNATENASEMIDHLTLVRNKARQAYITKELIEVVSGAEALK